MKYVVRSIFNKVPLVLNLGLQKHESIKDVLWNATFETLQNCYKDNIVGVETKRFLKHYWGKNKLEIIFK